MKLLHVLFEKQAQITPYRIALNASRKKMSYQDLSYYSNKIAHRLLQGKIKKNTLVAVVMEKGWEQIVAILGILKAGAAYLPIDIHEAPERLSYLLQMGEVEWVFTQKKHQSRLSSFSQIKILVVDDESVWINSSIETLPILQNEEDLAYVIFTSGTTGIPKGVMIDHKGAVNTILDINHRFQVNQKDRILAVSALHFDLSVYDIFGILAVGGTVVIPTDDESKDPSRWMPFFIKERITVLNCVPAFIDIFIECLSNLNKKNISENFELRLILLSGDWIPLTLPAKIRRLLGNEIEIVSLGGATEASIWSIIYPIQQMDKNWKSIPYGKPMKNQTFYILSDDLKPVTADEVGELHIGGVGLAKGYWRDAERTQASFISHPELGRLYKTGDLGRYLLDGNIEFLGRLDYQVKINGLRIELSAIESALLEYPAVRHACVIAGGNTANKYLAAYVVLRQECIEGTLFLARLQVSHWHKIHNDLKESQKLPVTPTFNTQGWISSFTQQPIPSEIMQEWLLQTTARIRSLNPQKVLEVGCGLGLLLFQLSPHTAQYEGLDYSQSSIRYVRQYIKEMDKKISLKVGEAKDIAEIYAHKTFDMIILNSVIQYFPTVDYLIAVLDQAIQLTEPKGHIFIGDVCSLVHLPILHAAAQWNQMKQEMPWMEWKARLDYSLLQEEELFIDHRFFYALQQRNPRISAVDIQIKRGHFSSEMNLFRYDVTLYIDHPCSSISHFKKIEWDKECLNLTSARALLEKNEAETLLIQNIPNKRVAGFERILLKGHYSSCSWTKEAKQALKEAQDQAIDSEALYLMGEELGYYVSVTWAEKKPVNDVDALFVRKGALERAYKTSETFPVKNIASESTYSNMPLRPKAVDIIVQKLRKFLRRKLPSYMVPHVFMTLDALPMNSNGKIDRQALPPAQLNLRVTEYISPSTREEKKLSQIWSNVLKLEKIGIHDNFYELGGTSLLAVVMIVEVEKAFQTHLNVGDIIFHGQTIQALNQLLSQKLKKRKQKKNAVKTLQTLQ